MVRNIVWCGGVVAALVVMQSTGDAAGVAAAALAGVGLVLWIVLELAVLQRFFFLQPVIAAVGVLELALTAAAAPRRAAGLRVAVVRILRP